MMIKPVGCTRATTLLIIFVIVSQCTRIDAIYNNRQNVANQFLAPQNAARAAVGLRPLVWDRRVARYAKWYANQRRGDCDLRHSNGPYGENLFWGSGFGWTPAQAVRAWVDERKWYDHKTNACADGQVCGHYTQVIWGSTRRIGCAMIQCSGDKGQFITCNYDPPGNYYGEKPY